MTASNPKAATGLKVDTAGQSQTLQDPKAQVQEAKPPVTAFTAEQQKQLDEMRKKVELARQRHTEYEQHYDRLKEYTELNNNLATSKKTFEEQLKDINDKAA